MVMKVRVSPDSIAGHVDEGYGKLADVFRRNKTCSIVAFVGSLKTVISM